MRSRTTQSDIGTPQGADQCLQLVRMPDVVLITEGDVLGVLGCSRTTKRSSPAQMRWIAATVSRDEASSQTTQTNLECRRARRDSTCRSSNAGLASYVAMHTAISGVSIAPSRTAWLAAQTGVVHAAC